MSDPTKSKTFRFDVAFSFAGPHRDKVRAIAEIVRAQLDDGKVFFDEWFEHLLNGDNADVTLQRTYHEESLMVVMDVSEGYSDRLWCQAEATAIRSLRMSIDTARDQTGRLRLAYIRFADGDVPGVLKNVIHWDARKKSPQQLADLILRRLAELKSKVTSVTPLVSEAKIASAPSSAQSPKRRFSRILKWLGMVVLLLLALLFWAVFHQRQNPAFRIVVAEIDGPDKGLTGALIEKLRKETQKHKGILIVPSKQRISVQDGSAAAARLAARENADLVIWGRNPASPDYITLYFEPKQQHLRTVLAAGTEGVTRIYPEGQLGHYDIQQRLSSEVSSLALFIMARVRMEQDHDREALDLLNQIIEKTTSTNGFFGYAEALFERARCYDGLGSNCTVLIRELSRVITLSTNFTDAYLARAETYRKWKVRSVHRG